MLPADRWLNSKPSLYNGVILRDVSPEEPALSEVEGIWRASAPRAAAKGVSASRQILHGLKAVQDDALVRRVTHGPALLRHKPPSCYVQFLPQLIMIRSYKGITPTIPQSCYVDDSAQLIGDVVLGDHASIWMNAVLRGDVHSIRVGAHSNVQDCSVLHGMKAAVRSFSGRVRHGGPLRDPAWLHH